MKTIIFEYARGFGDTLTEECIFEDDATEDEIEEEFKDWVWEIIGDNVAWHEK